jgi:hypothetical protein
MSDEASVEVNSNVYKFWRRWKPPLLNQLLVHRFHRFGVRAVRWRGESLAVAPTQLQVPV